MRNPRKGRRCKDKGGNCFFLYQGNMPCFLYMAQGCRSTIKDINKILASFLMQAVLHKCSQHEHHLLLLHYSIWFFLIMEIACIFLNCIHSDQCFTIGISNLGCKLISLPHWKAVRNNPHKHLALPQFRPCSFPGHTAYNH